MVKPVDYLETLEARIEIKTRLLRTEDPSAILESADLLDSCDANLLYGYVRTFVKLAYSGNVNSVADRLGMTRQSIKNHIVQLENLLEAALFERVGTNSRLTDMGTLWLPRAQEFYEAASVFLRRTGAKNARYRSTNLPLRMLIKDETSSNLLRRFAHSYNLGANETDHPEFLQFREECIVYEVDQGAWGSQQIGSKTPFAQWFGVDAAQNSTGKPLSDMVTGDDLRDEISFALDECYLKGGLHFAEVACDYRTPNGDGRETVFYQRLLADMTKEKGRPQIVSLIDVVTHPQTSPERA